MPIKTHEPHKLGNKLSDVILGGQDGLVSILGLLLGLTAATSSTRIVVAGGLAMILAETLSMAAVAYTSKMADREHYAAERKREASEIIDFPAIERKEIEDIYSQKGFRGKLLKDIVDHITSSDELWIETMMKEELNLQKVDKNTVYMYSVTVGLSTLVGSLLPLTPFFVFATRPAMITSLVMSAALLAAVGVYKARQTFGSPIKSAIQMVAIGMGAAVAGYLIGLLFKA
jgi:VIT1/CCC1 family predicted Fe2+/Mn2+ transporter